MGRSTKNKKLDIEVACRSNKTYKPIHKNDNVRERCTKKKVKKNNSERPVDALAVEKGESLTHFVLY